MGRKAGFLASLFGLAVMILAAALLWYRAELEKPGPLDSPVTLIIAEGTSATAIAEELERRKIVSSATLFLLRTRWRREAHLLKAGEYAFEPGERIDSVITRLARGDALMHSLTVPEGLSSVETLAILAGHEILEGSLDDLPAEGRLLPETYYFERGTTRQAIVERMTQAMDAVVAELWARRAEGLPLKSPEEAVILASIVEKETGRADERAHVAGVLINRLRLGMPLQSDPTVIYSLTKGLAPLGRELLRSDWKHPDPYNTYFHAGLPPGPIANPGHAALEAVLDPLVTLDLYFVADGEGGHAFAETLDAHNRNVARYRSLRTP